MNTTTLVLMIIAICLAANTAAFAIINVIKPSRWKSIVHIVSWSILLAYLISAGLYLAITQ